ncbi:hypothetical protein [Prosthecobacter debontii]|uniref:hypothetical protein n=1 Tax=Prosthecobacter debontii TaxID=48467 RepID=UPI00099A0D75|nr:hypothetical protein [Prosthecobacter debontii]
MKLTALRLSGIIAALYGAAFFGLGNLRTRTSSWCHVRLETDTSSFEHRFHTFVVPVAIIPFKPYLWIRDSLEVGLGPWDYLFAPMSLGLLLWFPLWGLPQIVASLAAD